MNLSEFISMYTMDFFSLSKFDFTRAKVYELINEVKLIDEIQFLQIENEKQMIEILTPKIGSSS
jgi:hypothetical protein